MDKGTARLEQKLRQKFICVAFAVVFCVLFLIAVTINSFNYYQVQHKAEQLLEIISRNDGTFPQPTTEPMGNPVNPENPVLEEEALPLENPPQENPPQKNPPQENMPLENPPQENMPHPQGNQWQIFLTPSLGEESFFTTRFFTIRFDQNGTLLALDTSNVRRIVATEAEEMGQTLFASGKSQGLYDFYFYQAIPQENQETLLIFVDISDDLFFFQQFFYSSVGICLVALAMVFLLLVFLSKKAVSPIVEAYARQKYFITDLSHELKTPLAIVKANTEVLELEHGESQWSQGVHKQVAKLNQLIAHLLSLAKLEEHHNKSEQFSLSKITQEAGDCIKVLLLQQGKTLEMDIQDQLEYQGDPLAIRQILDILLENAAKYSSPKSQVQLSLCREKHSIVLRVENQGQQLRKGYYDQWFQRFYREDSSRNSETGGFGLGLSLAKTLVQNQKGKITALSPQGDTLLIKVEFRGKN